MKEKRQARSKDVARFDLHAKVLGYPAHKLVEKLLLALGEKHPLLAAELLPIRSDGFLLGLAGPGGLLSPAGDDPQLRSVLGLLGRVRSRFIAFRRSRGESFDRL